MKRTWLAIAVTMITTGCSYAVTHKGSTEVSKLILHHSAIETPVPPSFLGHPLAYMFAVMGQLTVFSVAMAVTFFIISNLDIKRDSCMKEGKKTWQSPVNVYRVAILCLMITTLMATASNLLIFLGWNEVNPDTTLRTFFTIEKVFKTMLAVPFLTGVYLLVVHNETLTMQLAFHNCPQPIWPARRELREHVWMLLWIVILAFGVTCAKWGEFIAL